MRMRLGESPVNETSVRIKAGVAARATQVDHVRVLPTSKETEGDLERDGPTITTMFDHTSPD